MRIRRPIAALAVAFAAGAGLTGCSPTVNLTPAPEAADPACAAVTVRLPDAVGDLPKRTTNAQATGAWGDPATVVLRCGVAVPGPTTDGCVSIPVSDADGARDEIDWITEQVDETTYRFTTYGRVPAVEIVIDNTVVSGDTALDAVSDQMIYLERTSACTDPSA